MTELDPSYWRLIWGPNVLDFATREDLLDFCVEQGAGRVSAYAMWHTCAATS